MPPRVFGLETEYAVAELRSGGRQVGFLGRLMELAAAHLPHLPGHCDSGLFLVNGSRFYLDAGHPELATPEVQDPWDAVRYVKAGDRIMLDLAAAVRSESPWLKPLFLRGNVDYSGAGTTWGCHESYLHESKLDGGELAAQLIPHLVSRIVFAGAGGFNPGSLGIEFTLSPRAWHLRRAISASSTADRGIFNTREEALCGPPYRRLHLLCGDSLCSETSLWLTVATTALVVALIEAGKAPGDAVRLRDPVRALLRFASDPGLRARVSLPGARRGTAISIQRHYLAQAERHLGEGFMPDWAREACDRWRRTLDGLPHESARTLDWQIKLATYREQVRRSPLDARQIAHCNSLLAEVPARRDPEPRSPGGRGSAPAGPIQIGRRRDTPLSRTETILGERGVPVEDARRFVKLRARLMDMETRYGALGEEGLFEGLDRTGGLRHRVVAEVEIEAAKTGPPAVGRARLRGEAVRRLAPGRMGSCSWSGVVDRTRKEVLDLSNPFETEEKWRPMGDSPAPDRRASHAASILRLFRDGDI